LLRRALKPGENIRNRLDCGFVDAFGWGRRGADFVEAKALLDELKT
jgi:hypothetical protein